MTGLVAGEPVLGSWWSHPLAKTIYNSLVAIEDEVLTVKLVRKKDTLIARRLWPEFLAIANGRAPWHLRRLSVESLAVLDAIESADGPMTVTTDQRAAAKALAERLLVHATDIHIDAGHHVKAYTSWRLWASDNAVVAASGAAAAADAFEQIVRTWPPAAGVRLVPWPANRAR